jgi:hypothetical protein
LSQQIEILSQSTCSKFTNEDSKYFLSKLLYLYIKHNKILTWMLPSHPWCLIFIMHIIFVNKSSLFRAKNLNSKNLKIWRCELWRYPRKLCACCRKTRHQSVKPRYAWEYSVAFYQKMVFCQNDKIPASTKTINIFVNIISMNWWKFLN